MSTSAPDPAHGQHQPLAMGLREFVALIAALMAMIAIGVDSMLPALPAIGRSFRLANENEAQFVISIFLMGTGIGQLAYGPLSDRYGRRPVLAAALTVYALTSFVAAASTSFPLFLLARLCGGLAIAASRVLSVAIVRDVFAGRAMARVMSLAMMVFLVTPIIAPSIGQAVLMIAPWRAIFYGIAAASGAVLIWAWLRLPETLRHPQPLSVARVVAGYGRTLTERASLGYTLASVLLLGPLYGFIYSAQQIVFDVLHRPDLLSLVFAAVGGTMVATNLANAALVMRLGMRRISHSALIILIIISAGHLALALAGGETLVSFVVLQSAGMACFGLASANFSAMAMEKMGAIAGTASSLQGFATVTFGALIGMVIGQSFNDTTVPLYAGFTGLSLASLAVVLIVERGRLFRAT